MNIAWTHAPDVRLAIEMLKNARIWVSSLGPAQIRVVFHRDITDDSLAWAIDRFRSVAEILGQEAP